MVARVARICGKSDTAPLELMYFVLQQHERGGDDGVCGLMQTQTWYKLSLKQDMACLQARFASSQFTCISIWLSVSQLSLKGSAALQLVLHLSETQGEACPSTA